MSEDEASGLHSDTVRAMKAVGETAPADYILEPKKHAAALPDEAAALRRVLETKPLQELANRYIASDRKANASQGRYKSLGYFSIRASFFMVLIGGGYFALASGPFEIGPQTLSVLREGAIVGESLLMVAALLVTMLLKASGVFDRWMMERAAAEQARVGYFARMIATPGDTRSGEIPLLPLKLEYFRRYLLENQENFFDRRGTQHARQAGRTMVARVGQGVLAVIASAPSIVVTVDFLTDWELPLGDQWDPVFLFAGLLAAASMNLILAKSLMDLNERSAARYSRTLENLRFLKERQLKDARRAAIEGREAEVAAFAKEVQAYVASEHQEWLVARESIPAAAAV